VVPTTIRVASHADIAPIQRLAVTTDMFGEDAVGFFDEMISGALDGTLPHNHWLVVDDDAVVVAAAYYAPEPFSDRLWNLYFISVAPDYQGRGTGGTLLSYVEDQLRTVGPDVARVLLIETSSTDQYRHTREFYRRHGYDEEARIREFYGPGDDKIVFWKSLHR
jgi:ribosomal protein S18 acetylase RimI-like enzyme